ncbi:ABC transporter permease [Kitasatospora sp. NPDC093679]|uniref:ABC transporter permease n=1 Tax=Kitasatospora sp. NPDC093679 TaxID=3154983 RepID=UPI003430CD2D
MPERRSTTVALSTALRQFGHGLISSHQDYRSMFTWRSWAGGWLVRLLCQVLFFATLGTLLGSAQATGEIAFGNAAALGPLAALGVVSSTVGERRSGTLEFLLVTRANPFLVLASRGLHWVLDGMLTSSVALAVVPLLLPVPLHLPALPAVVAVNLLVSLSSYCLALTLSGISLRHPESRMYLTAGTTIGYLLLCGITTPVPQDGLPARLAAVLPITHGLALMRRLAEGAPFSFGPLLAEAGVALLWGVAAYLTLGLALRRAVRTGSLVLH